MTDRLLVYELQELTENALFDKLKPKMDEYEVALRRAAAEGRWSEDLPALADEEFQPFVDALEERFGLTVRQADTGIADRYEASWHPSDVTPHKQKVGVAAPACEDVVLF